MTIIMHRTRNRGVVGVNGWHTKGPFYSAKKVTRSPMAAPKTKGKK